MSLAGYGAWHKLQERLQELGFYPDPTSPVICRFTFEGITIDVMPDDAQILGFSNPWYKPGLDQSSFIALKPNLKIRILPVAYFLATKFSAYHSRGGDPRTSHDFEDIIYTTDNRLHLIEDESLKAKKLEIYKSAVLNESTIQDFVVIKVQNKSTGETKEICTKGNFLSGAIHQEYDIDYSEEGEAKANEILLNSKNRKFELSKAEALGNIGFDDYSEDELKAFERRVEAGNFSYSNDREMTMLAHILFNKGVKSSENSCFGGELIFVKK
ncbi:hypothetical protein [Pontibacter flavimaris]|uniref:hypothetical protein n=1 Tax=Pontibacter flavimaris TaxID=1797110 RepID=UPI0011151BB2|nr:hypothetical protein [Pontibacter flavimaris]